MAQPPLATRVIDVAKHPSAGLQQLWTQETVDSFDRMSQHEREVLAALILRRMSQSPSRDEDLKIIRRAP